MEGAGRRIPWKEYLVFTAAKARIDCTSGGKKWVDFLKLSSDIHMCAVSPIHWYTYVIHTLTLTHTHIHRQEGNTYKK